MTQTSFTRLLLGAVAAGGIGAAGVVLAYNHHEVPAPAVTVHRVVVPITPDTTPSDGDLFNSLPKDVAPPSYPSGNTVIGVGTGGIGVLA